MNTLTVKISNDMLYALDQAAADAHSNRSDVVREAITAYVAQNKPKPARSALDLVSDLIGTGSGPGDLSTNKGYLRDIGQGVDS